ncbi:TetR/AcrR family transcriptional regulator [Nocardia panacis]|uniref:TetR/AcrR family transcriptional regulator n=1 Tax=Nocardia panacis TaxID=2340916 RepID=A0A3A4KZN5_9NOCA|nr:TetR/AcrR family transcriptional regulator [Nocardia panacis]
MREAVIAAAQRILVESGVARLSTKEVAAGAGVAESSIFYHFGDRVGLLQAVIAQHVRPLKEALLDSPGHGELRADLVEVVMTLEQFFHSAIPVIAAIQSDSGLRAKFLERGRDSDLGPHRALDVVVARLGAVPGADRIDLRALALLLVGAAHQRALQRHLSPPAALATLPSADALVDALIPVFPKR